MTADRMPDAQPTECPAVVPSSTRNADGKAIQAGLQCMLDTGHEGPHHTLQRYMRADDPTRVSSIAAYDWYDPAT